MSLLFNIISADMFYECEDSDDTALLTTQLYTLVLLTLMQLFLNYKKEPVNSLHDFTTIA